VKPQNYKPSLGLEFRDVSGKRVLTFQLLNEDNRSVAILVVYDEQIDRFLKADSAPANALELLLEYYHLPEHGGAQTCQSR
jgi:hypothetical protein